MSNISNINRGDSESHLAYIWEALESYRETLIPEGDDDYDRQWDDICTAMAWIREDLGLNDGVQS